MRKVGISVTALLVVVAAFASPQAPKKGPQQTPFQAKLEDLQQIRAKIEQLEAAVKALKAKGPDADLMADVEVYAKAGRILLEFPELVANQNAINHAIAVLDAGIERARQLDSGESPWTRSGKQTHGYYSAIDGSVQPYGVTVPASYDGKTPTRLYVWMHGRQNNTIETEFLFNFLNSGPGRPPVADNGQIQLDVF